MTDKLLCPQCEKGQLAASTWDDDFRHGDGTIHVDGLECYVCDQCGADPVFTDQIRRNQRRIADAKRRVDKMLVSEEIRALREQFGLTQQDAAVLFGGGANAFSKYERGDVTQSVAMDRLLKLVRVCPFLLPVLQEMAGMNANPSALSEEYSQTTQVCVNDPNYRSRTVQGTSVVVNMSDWAETRAA